MKILNQKVAGGWKMDTQNACHPVVDFLSLQKLAGKMSVQLTGRQSVLTETGNQQASGEETESGELG